MVKKKKRLLLFLAYTFSAAVISAVGFLFVASSQFKTNLNQNNLNQTILSQDQKLSNQADIQSIPTLGTVRRWQNNNFTGTQIIDGGFVVLTGDDVSGYSASRTNSFGGVLWTYNPQTYNADPNLLAGNDNTTTYAASDIKNKGVVEIRQDSYNPLNYYLLLVPKKVLNDPSESISNRSYDEIVADPSLQATIIRIQENLNNINDPFKIISFANVSPQEMVKNYPSTWTVANGPSFFSKADHPQWFDNSNTMNMDTDQYITNLGNMYVSNGYVLMFGGNGTEFFNPEALSIGVYRLNFNNPNNIEVTGIPYAYILAGLATDRFEGRYFSRLPVGQDGNFSYVPRIAVGGASSYPGLKPAQSPMVFLAGSITVGQDNQSWEWADLLKDEFGGIKPRPTMVGLSVNNSFNPNSADLSHEHDPITKFTDLKGYGSYGDKFYSWNASGTAANQNYTVRWSNFRAEPDNSLHIGANVVQTNFIPVNPLRSNATQKNSVDPLTLAGFKLSLAGLLNLDTKNIADVTSSNGNHSYVNIIDSNFMDFGINPGLALGFHISSGGNEVAGNGVTGGNGQFGRPQQAFDGGLGMFTSLFGYSPKSVGNLLPYDSKRVGTDGKENNLGFVMQVGAFIYFFNLSGYDGYAELSNYYFKPVINYPSDDPLVSVPVKPEGNMLILNANANNLSKYHTYNLMPSAAYYEDAAIGYNKSYFDPTTNQLAGANSSTLESNIAWSDFSGLAVINNSQPSVVSLWSVSDDYNKLYINNGFSGPGLADNKGNTLSSDLNTTSGDRDLVVKYPQDGSFYINNNESGTQSVNNTLVSEQSKDNLERSLVGLKAIISGPNQSSYYFQDEGLGLNYYHYSMMSLSLEAEFKNAAVDQKKYLGSGSFISDPGEIITTKNISELYDKVGDLNVLKSAYFSQIFNYQEPTSFIDTKKTPLDKRILLTKINVVMQTATFTAEVKNPFTNQYEIIPSNTNTINQNAHVTYDKFFGKQPSYLLAVAIAVPIVVVALIVGLGCGIGIPISRNKKALKHSFDISNKKVDTLTTAVGSVFKQIINKTQNNQSKTTQMLSTKNKPNNKLTVPSAVKKPVGASHQAPKPPANNLRKG